MHHVGILYDRISLFGIRSRLHAKLENVQRYAGVAVTKYRMYRPHSGVQREELLEKRVEEGVFHSIL